MVTLKQTATGVSNNCKIFQFIRHETSAPNCASLSVGCELLAFACAYEGELCQPCHGVERALRSPPRHWYKFAPVTERSQVTLAETTFRTI